MHVVSSDKEKAINALNLFLDAIPSEDRAGTNRHDFFMAGYKARNQEIGQAFVAVSERNLFPERYGDGTILTGVSPNDIYQLGYADAFNACWAVMRPFCVLNDGEISESTESALAEPQ